MEESRARYLRGEQPGKGCVGEGQVETVKSQEPSLGFQLLSIPCSLRALVSATAQRSSASSPQSTRGKQGSADLLQGHRTKQGQLVSQRVQLGTQVKTVFVDSSRER